MKNIVYVLSNPRMLGLLKIGRTGKSASDRAEQLYSSGVPAPFAVEATYEADEHEIHALLQIYRANVKREFFELGASAAKRLIEDHLSKKSTAVPFDMMQRGYTCSKCKETGLSGQKVRGLKHPEGPMCRACYDALAYRPRVVVADGIGDRGNLCTWFTKLTSHRIHTMSTGLSLQEVC